jgi:hypothetical protein
MKHSESLFYDVVNAKGIAVHFKMLGYERAERPLAMYERAFTENGPYKIVLTKPQPTDRRTPEKGK